MSEPWEQNRMYILGKIKEHTDDIQVLKTSTIRLHLDSTVNLNQQTNELKERINTLDKKIVKIVTAQNLILTAALILLKFVFKVL